MLQTTKITCSKTKRNFKNLSKIYFKKQKCNLFNQLHTMRKNITLERNNGN